MTQTLVVLTSMPKPRLCTRYPSQARANRVPFAFTRANSRLSRISLASRQGVTSKTQRVRNLLQGVRNERQGVRKRLQGVRNADQGVRKRAGRNGNSNGFNNGTKCTAQKAVFCGPKDFPALMTLCSRKVSALYNPRRDNQLPRFHRSCAALPPFFLSRVY